MEPDDKIEIANTPETPAEDKPQEPAEANSAPEAPQKAKHPWLAWLTMLLTIGAWVVLAWVNGYAAVALGFVAICMAIASIAINRGPLRRLSITALVAALVLEIVVGAFLIILRML